jgi:hypothetical protein
LADIVARTLQSLDLNPLLINTLNNVTSLVDGVVGEVVGAVDGLLGSITQGGTTLNFLVCVLVFITSIAEFDLLTSRQVDNLGNIVQDVSGASSIVGNYLNNSKSAQAGMR